MGTAAVLGSLSLPQRSRRALDAAFHLPVAVPSVVVGVSLLVAFSRPPLLLNGTSAIVVLAQTLLVLTFTYSMVYPPSRRTLPVSIFSLSDRGDVFLASADTLVLLVTTCLVLTIVGGRRRRRGRGV